MTDNNKIVSNATVEVARKFLEEGYLLIGNAEKAYALPVPDHICEQVARILKNGHSTVYKGAKTCSASSSSSYTVYFHTVIRGLLLVISEKFDFNKHQWVFADIKLIQIEKEEKEGKKYQLITPYIEDSISWYMDLWDNK